jgi:hypothetical protein
MGFLMKDDDIYIPSLLNLFNLRFGPAQGSWERSPLYGGILEIAALQREFQIFRVGRPFAQSAALLGLGGLTNNQTKNRWLELLTDLATYDSDEAGVNGDQRIVGALIANFNTESPKPCFMEAHDSRKEDARRVFVRDNDTPLFYIEEPKYLTISLPMKPRSRG